MALPPAGYLSNSGRTQGEEKTAFEDLRNAVAALVGSAPEPTLTIAAGVIQPGSEVGGLPAAIYRVDTEASASVDDLTNINPTKLWDGAVICIRASSSSRVVTVKYNAGGTGAILTLTGTDVVLSTRSWLTLKLSVNTWEEMDRGPGQLFAPGAAGAGFVLQSDPVSPWGATPIRYQSSEQGRLYAATPTALTLYPYKGNEIPVQTTGAGWRMRSFGAGIVSGNPTQPVNFVGDAPNQQLAANGTYCVFVFDNNGVLTFNFRNAAMGHAADPTTGVEIGAGGANPDFFTLVGMVRTDASRQFVNTPDKRLVASWFNRQLVTAQIADTSTRTTTSATLQLRPNATVEFLTWGALANTGGVPVHVWMQGSTDLAANWIAAATLDSVQVAGAVITSAIANASILAALEEAAYIAEGYHTAGQGYVSDGTRTLTLSGTNNRTIVKVFI